MNSLAYIPASDGAANASLMTVTNVRAGGATTIQVNTVANAPTKFYASYGTPHTFTDPVTGETITVISEATAVDFAGHIDGSNVEIDEIAPGYTDNGNEVGDIIVIRPVTEWANNLFNLLGVTHNDDGSLKDAIVSTGNLEDDAVTLPKTEAGFAKRLGLDTKTTINTVLATSYTTYLTVTATSTGGEVEIDARAVLTNAGSGASRKAQIQVQCDGVDIATDMDLSMLYATGDGAAQAISPNSIISHTPAAGEHTWTIQLKASAASSVYLHWGSLKVSEISS